MSTSESIIPDIKELGGLVLGFLPWLLFLFLSGHSLASLERAILISLITCLVFGYGELKRGFILQWGTFLFFSLCAVMINLFHVVWVASSMDLLSNSALAFVMWLTMALGKPFVASRAPVILDEFGRLGLFTDHSPECMRARILEAHAQRDTWRNAMADYIVRDRERFLRQTREIREMLGFRDTGSA